MTTPKNLSIFFTKILRTSPGANLSIPCTKTQAPLDQGANTLDQADLAQPVSEIFQCRSPGVRSSQYSPVKRWQ